MKNIALKSIAILLLSLLTTSAAYAATDPRVKLDISFASADDQEITFEFSSDKEINFDIGILKCEGDVVFETSEGDEIECEEDEIIETFESSLGDTFSLTPISVEEGSVVEVYLQSYEKSTTVSNGGGDKITEIEVHLKPVSSDDDEDDADEEETEDSKEMSAEMEALYEKIISLLMQLIAQLNK